MIPANEKVATTGYTTNGVSFSIDEEDMAFIFGILRNNMYSNPIKISVQEPLCNGRDAGRAIGNVIRPMEVEIPTDDFKFFTVRDFGPSLTYEQMVDVFCKYGKSTKRGTNQTGGFGIGAKSPWAYNNEFFVDTFIDNKKTSYRFYIDEETERGKMEVISTSKVEAENGLKVIIPVKEGDAKEFITSFEFVTRYWGVKPKVLNGSVEYITNEAEIEDDWIIYKNRGAYSKAAILVDDIPYPIDVSALDVPEHLKNFVELPIHFFCSFDDVDVAASREQLNYTKKTSEFLLNEFQRAYDTCKKNLEEEISKYKTYPEAYVNWIAHDNSKWRKIYKVDWKGISLNIKHFLEKIPHVNNWRNGNNYTKLLQVSLDSYVRNGLSVHNNSSLIISRPIIVIPSTNKRIPYARVRRALEELKTRGIVEVTCIHFPDDEEKSAEVWTHLKEKCHWDILDTYELDDFKKKSEGKRKVAKSNGNISEFRLSCSRIHKKLADISSLEGYYCEGKYNSVDLLGNGDFLGLDECSTLRMCLRSYFNIDKVYSIPNRYLSAAKKNPKLTLISDLVKNNKKKIFNKRKCNRISKLLDNQYDAYSASRIYYYIGETIQENSDKLDPSSEIRKFFEKYSSSKSVTEAEKTYIRDMKYLYNYKMSSYSDKKSDKKCESIEKEKYHIKNKYPLLSRLDTYSSKTSNITEHMILYINAVDSCS